MYSRFFGSYAFDVFSGLELIRTVATTAARTSALLTLPACTAGRSRAVNPAAGETTALFPPFHVVLAIVVV
jgi:uncharacterized protein (DUF2062 family)